MSSGDHNLANELPELPETVAFTRFEGGTWERFHHYPHPYTVHAVLFEDGSIWDSVNGWRPEKDLELVAIQRAIT